MALHIHYKNGKFAIWSTVVDAYVSAWYREEEQDFIIAKFIEHEIPFIMDNVRRQWDNAKKSGCSALKPARHKRSDL